MTDQELQEYCFETGQQLLGEDVQVQDLMLHNEYVKQGQARGRDEEIDRIVKASVEKADIKQNLTGKFRFAMRLHGRKFPERLKQPAAERLLLKYDE